jgi:hypothetical protein
MMQLLHCTRAIWKVTSSELITKQAMRKEIINIKNTCILKVLFSVITIRIEALVVPEHEFLYTCVNEVCRL